METPELDFTLDDLEAWLAQLPQPMPEGVTTREVMEWGHYATMEAAREKFVRPLVRAGKLRPGRVLRTSELSGIPQRINGFLFVREEKADERE